MIYLDSMKGLTGQGAWPAVACCRRAVLVLAAAIFLVLVTYSPAAAQTSQITIDGNITETSWHKLGARNPTVVTALGFGHELNAFYADIDSTHLYMGVAGNVVGGYRILVFIDSRFGGYNHAGFGRIGAPPGVSGLNSSIRFDASFLADYVLVIGLDSGIYTWYLYPLSSIGGPSSGYLGTPDGLNRGAAPIAGSFSETRGFETRLTYSQTGFDPQTGIGTQLQVDQPSIKFFAMYISDSGYLSNQFIGPALSSIGDIGNGAISFDAPLSADPVTFPHFLVVNEIDYTQPGGDIAEFIEIKNITNLTVNLDPYFVELINGSIVPPARYRLLDLPNVPLGPGQYYTICGNPIYVPNCNFVEPVATGLLENVLPSAVALRYNLTEPRFVIDTVSYGGITAPPFTEGGGGAPALSGGTMGLGISRFPDGIDTNQNHLDFWVRCITPGRPNSDQTGNCPVVVTPTPTGTLLPTSTPTATQPPTPLPTLPAGCTNVLVNGDFERDGSWMFGGSPIPGQFTSIEKRSGLRAVRLGDPDGGQQGGWGMDKVSYSSIRQPVTIPGSASIAQLRWWHFYRSDEAPDPNPSAMSDRQEVILLTPHGKTLRVLERVRRNESGWSESLLDLTEFRGQSFFLYFNVFNDKSGSRTWGFLDDVVINVCYPEVTSTPISTSTPTPTVTMPPTPIPTPIPTWTVPPGITPFEIAPSITVFTPTATVTPTITVAPAVTVTPTALFTPTATIVPTNGVTSSLYSIPASIALVDAPTVLSAPPAECLELVNNGNFEAAGSGWELTPDAAAPTYATEITFNRSRQALRLGITSGENVPSISAAGQSITLPDDATSIILSFRYYPLYEEPPGPGDLQYVDLYNVATGQFAGRALGDQMNDRTWLTTDYDLTAQAGQTLRLLFAVNNDGVEGRTAMYVDNVSVMACYFRNLVSPGLLATPTQLPATSKLLTTPRSPAALELPARQDLAERDEAPRAWMARLGTVGMLVGVLGLIGFVALVIMGARSQG